MKRALSFPVTIHVLVVIEVADLFFCSRFPCYLPCHLHIIMYLHAGNYSFGFGFENPYFVIDTTVIGGRLFYQQDATMFVQKVNYIAHFCHYP